MSSHWEKYICCIRHIFVLLIYECELAVCGTEEEEEKEMQIGLPTDVKHVAHIGWDGPAVSSPSWMNEFKSTEGAIPGNPRESEDVRGDSEGSSARRNARDSQARDLPALPRPSRRQPSMDSTGSDSPLGSPSSQKSKELKHSRRRHSDSSHKESKEGTHGSRSSRHKEVSSPRGGESSSHSVPNIPKKSRRKKSKDGEGSVRSSSRSKGHCSSTRGGSSHGSDDGSSRSYTSETFQSSGLATLHEEEVKG
ncbi:hypothetical protein Droror1_Dr00018945 [Drosera rotundifolia]